MSSSLNMTPEWDINNFYIRPEKIKDKKLRYEKLAQKSLDKIKSL